MDPCGDYPIGVAVLISVAYASALLARSSSLVARPGPAAAPGKRDAGAMLRAVVDLVPVELLLALAGLHVTGAV
jgi:hypothetical protein